MKTLYLLLFTLFTLPPVCAKGHLWSTFAGKAKSIGSMDGAGGEARFSEPRGITADGSGNVYVADTRNNIIRRITPEGAVSTLAGRAGVSGGADGTGGDVEPRGIAVDAGGGMYVCG